MSENKRKRLTKPMAGEAIVEETVTVESNEERVEEESWLNEDGTFNWDGYESTCITNTRKPNPHIKTNGKDRVFCREPYAQKHYDIYAGHESVQNMRVHVNVGDIVDGRVYAVSSEWMTLDVDYREMIYVKLSKEPAHILEDYKPGDEVSVLITSDGYDTASNNAHITGSVSGGMKQRVFRDLQSGVDTADTAWVGRVSHMIENGGYIVAIQGVECFMPGSLAGINKLHDFESIIGQEMYVVPVSFSPERGTIVVSHRKYLQAMIPTEIQNLKAAIEDNHLGEVTGTAKYGVFVEFNTCLTGMIHVNDLDEEKSKLVD